jgi:hypothetical protein
MSLIAPTSGPRSVGTPDALADLQGLIDSRRLVFIDETWTETNMTRLRGRSPQFPPDIIRQAVWLYLRFALSFRNVEDRSPSVGWMSLTKRSADGC